MKTLDPAGRGRIRFSVSLVPGASKNEVVGWRPDGLLKIRVTARPVDEAANRELVRFLAKLLQIRKGDTVIVSGLHSKTKRLQVPESCKNRLLSISDI